MTTNIAIFIRTRIGEERARRQSVGYQPFRTAVLDALEAITDLHADAGRPGTTWEYGEQTHHCHTCLTCGTRSTSSVGHARRSGGRGDLGRAPGLRKRVADHGRIQSMNEQPLSRQHRCDHTGDGRGWGHPRLDEEAYAHACCGVPGHCPHADARATGLALLPASNADHVITDHAVADAMAHEGTDNE